MPYERIIYYMVAYVSFVFAGVFDNSTIYVSGSMGTPYINGNIELEDDYKYSIGLRKIALFPYQSSKKFYKGEDNWLGAFDGDELCGIYWYTITEKEMYDGFLISSKHGVGIKLGRELVERTKDKWTVNWSMCSEKYIKFNERLGFKVWSYMLIDKYKVYLLKRIQ